MKKDRVLLLIAILVSVVAIGIALYRSFHLDWDAIMFAVAMLSGLVVLLIGWNIYTIFDMRGVEGKINKRIDIEIKNLANASISLQGSMKAMGIMLYESILVALNRNEYNGDHVYAIISICTAKLYCDQGDIKGANRTISDLDKRLSTTTAVIEPEAKEALLNLLLPIKEIYKSEDLNSVVMKILTWKTPSV